MKYLGKKKVFEMVKTVAGYENMPKCCDCAYTFHGGYEWLKFYTPDYDKRVVFTVYKCGVYVRIEEFDLDDLQIRNEFISNLQLAMCGICI